MYDFANSAFATTILAVIFNQYFATVVAGGEKGVELLGFRVADFWLLSGRRREQKNSHDFIGDLVLRCPITWNPLNLATSSSTSTKKD